MIKLKAVIAAISLVMIAVLPVYPVSAVEDDQEVVTGKLYCITASADLIYKAGVCPVDHMGHIMITDDGKALMISHKGDELLRKIAIPSGATVKMVTRIIKDLNVAEVEELRIPVGPGQ